MMDSRKRSFLVAGLVVIAAVGIFAWTSFGQFGRSKYTSPPANSSINIAGKQISVEYYAPSMHGRKVMGGLVPFWRRVVHGRKLGHGKSRRKAIFKWVDWKLSAGSFTAYGRCRGANEWTLIVNKQTGQFHLDYDSSLDFGRTKMNLKTLADPVETFRIDLRSDGGNKGTLALIWEKTEASIPFAVNP